MLCILCMLVAAIHAPLLDALSRAWRLGRDGAAACPRAFRSRFG